MNIKQSINVAYAEKNFQLNFVTRFLEQKYTEMELHIGEIHMRIAYYQSLNVYERGFISVKTVPMDSQIS